MHTGRGKSGPAASASRGDRGAESHGSPPEFDAEASLLGDDNGALDTAADTEGQPDEIAQTLHNAPVVSADALQVLGADAFPQRALYGRILGQHASGFSTRALTPRLYMNNRASWSTLICGVQGSGKSHSTSVIIESALIQDARLGTLPHPLTGLVFHFETGSLGGLASPCEAAYVSCLDPSRAGSGTAPVVTVLVTPSNLEPMRQVYSGLSGVRVEPLKISESDLTGERILALMRVEESEKMPLYMESVMSILQSMTTTFTYREFRRRVEEQQFNPTQKAMLGLRFQLLDSFLEGGNSSNRLSNYFRPGNLTIVDLSSPFMDASSACGLFNIVLGLFVKPDGHAKTIGRLLVLDEAHRYLGGSGSAHGFTDSLAAVIREHRHTNTRVVISTQEPTVVPDNIIELSSCVVAHRFSSPQWAEHLMRHVSVSAHLREALFDKIATLNVGEAVLFAPAGLGVDAENAVAKFGRGYLHVRSRQRITHDGGASLLVGQESVAAPATATDAHAASWPGTPPQMDGTVHQDFVARDRYDPSPRPAAAATPTTPAPPATARPSQPRAPQTHQKAPVVEAHETDWSAGAEDGWDTPAGADYDAWTTDPATVAKTKPPPTPKARSVAPVAETRQDDWSVPAGAEDGWDTPAGADYDAWTADPAAAKVNPPPTPPAHSAFPVAETHQDDWNVPAGAEDGWDTPAGADYDAWTIDPVVRKAAKAPSIEASPANASSQLNPLAPVFATSRTNPPTHLHSRDKISYHDAGHSVSASILQHGKPTGGGASEGERDPWTPGPAAAQGDDGWGTPPEGERDPLGPPPSKSATASSRPSPPTPVVPDPVQGNTPRLGKSTSTAAEEAIFGSPRIGGTPALSFLRPEEPLGELDSFLASQGIQGVPYFQTKPASRATTPSVGFADILNAVDQAHLNGYPTVSYDILGTTLKHVPRYDDEENLIRDVREAKAAGLLFENGSHVWRQQSPDNSRLGVRPSPSPSPSVASASTSKTLATAPIPVIKDPIFRTRFSPLVTILATEATAAEKKVPLQKVGEMLSNVYPPDFPKGKQRLSRYLEAATLAGLVFFDLDSPGTIGWVELRPPELWPAELRPFPLPKDTSPEPPSKHEPGTATPSTEMSSQASATSTVDCGPSPIPSTPSTSYGQATSTAEIPVIKDPIFRARFSALVTALASKANFANGKVPVSILGTSISNKYPPEFATQEKRLSKYLQAAATAGLITFEPASVDRPGWVKLRSPGLWPPTLRPSRSLSVDVQTPTSQPAVKYESTTANPSVTSTAPSVECEPSIMPSVPSTSAGQNSETGAIPVIKDPILRARFLPLVTMLASSANKRVKSSSVGTSISDKFPPEFAGQPRRVATYLEAAAAAGLIDYEPESMGKSGWVELRPPQLWPPALRPFPISAPKIAQDPTPEPLLKREPVTAIAPTGNLGQAKSTPTPTAASTHRDQSPGTSTIPVIMDPILRARFSPLIAALANEANSTNGRVASTALGTLISNAYPPEFAGEDKRFAKYIQAGVAAGLIHFEPATVGKPGWVKLRPSHLWPPELQPSSPIPPSFVPLVDLFRSKGQNELEISTISELRITNPGLVKTSKGGIMEYATSAEQSGVIRFVGKHRHRVALQPKHL